MNIVLYLGIFAIALFFILLGYLHKNDADIFKIAGFSIMFILGVLLLPGVPGSIDYKTGTTLTRTEMTVSTNQTDITATETDLYSTYDNFTFGFLIAVLSVLGFTNVYFSRRVET